MPEVHILSTPAPGHIYYLSQGCQTYSLLAITGPLGCNLAHIMHFESQKIHKHFMFVMFLNMKYDFFYTKLVLICMKIKEKNMNLLLFIVS